MRLQDAVVYDPSLGWQALLQHRTGERARFEPLWQEIVGKGVEDFHWRSAAGFAGEVANFEITNGPIDQVYAWARLDRGNFPTGSEALPTEVIAIQFRYREGQTQLLKEDQERRHDGYIAIASARKPNTQDSTHIYIGVRDWNKGTSLEDRTAAITATWLVSLLIFKQLTGIELPGVRYEML